EQERGLDAPGLSLRDRTRSVGLEHGMGTLACVARSPGECRARPPPYGFEERSEQQRRHAEQDESVRPPAGREESEREPAKADGEAEQEVRRGHNEPARFGALDVARP